MKAAFPPNITQQLNDLLAELSRFASSIDADDAEIERLEASRAGIGGEVRNKARKELAEYEHNLVFVESIIKIARAHSAVEELIESREPAPFDKFALMKTQALIDSHSSCDPMAVKLYFQATAQRLGLTMRAEKVRSEIAAEGTNKSDYITRKLATSTQGRLRSQESYLELLRSSNFESTVKRASQFIEESGVEQGNKTVCLALANLDLPLPSVPDTTFLNSIVRSNGVEQNQDGPPQVQLPVSVECANGGCLFVKLYETNDGPAYEGVQRFVLDVMAANADSLERVDFIDPVNLNSTHYQTLASLSTGNAPLVQPAPNSVAEIKSRLSELDAEFSRLEKSSSPLMGSVRLQRVLILDQFPQAYDSFALSLARRVALNAERYGTLLVLIGKPPTRTTYSDEGILDDIESHSLVIEEQGPGKARITSESTGLGAALVSPLPMRERLPQALLEIISRKSEITVADNGFSAYLQHNRTSLTPLKGDRAIKDLPLGIDDSGQIVSLSLEDENFATFVCGASRSGKSTLLHTLLTDVFLGKHPDDVEVWLIDFKMTEFSRYIGHTPPHVKYVILDESPELVYDLIDRLVDYLRWRQKQFKKHQWEKLEDAQRAGKYMPAVLVVIDEFSVMSKIIADSVLSGKDYREKMQLLLSKGAALGFRFIFASQGFTKGTRGLSEYSKDQIQQRVAMKTTYEEIKATLDLPDISDKDKMEMEELEGHYALLKRPLGYNGGTSRLQKAHVLYFPSREAQLKVLSKALAEYVSGERYDASDQRSYLQRTPIILDGNERKEFDDAWGLVTARQDAWDSFDDTTALVCIGEPRRMEPYCPVELVNGYKENILMLASVSDGEPVQSIIACATQSLQSQDVEVDLCMGRSNRFMRGVAEKLGFARILCGAREVSSLVEEIDSRLQEGVPDRRVVILFDVESLLEDMGSAKSSSSNITPQWKKRPAGTPDTLQQLASGDIAPSIRKSADGVALSAASLADSFDAAKVLKSLVSTGPKQGCHFFTIVEDLQVLKASGISQDLFKHRVFFNSQRNSAQTFVSKADINALAETDPICFRYTNEIEGVTFRPYEHKKLGIFSSDDDGSDDEDYYYAG